MGGRRDGGSGSGRVESGLFDGSVCWSGGGRGRYRAQAASEEKGMVRRTKAGADIFSLAELNPFGS